MLDLTPRSVCANASLYDPRKSVPTNFKGETAGAELASANGNGHRVVLSPPTA